MVITVFTVLVSQNQERFKEMSKRNSFYSWLMKQVERNDPVGDLAQDVKRDSDAPKYAFREKRWRKHLKENNACDGAFVALTRAFDEFARHNSSPNKS